MKGSSKTRKGKEASPYTILRLYLARAAQGQLRGRFRRRFRGNAGTLGPEHAEGRAAYREDQKMGLETSTEARPPFGST